MLFICGGDPRKVFKMKKDLLSRDSVLASSLPVEDVEIPEWGGVIRIQAMSAARGAEYMRASQKINPDHILALLVTFCAVDGQGNLLFTPEDAASLIEKEMDPINKLGQAAVRINGMRKAAAENLAEPQDGASDSD